MIAAIIEQAIDAFNREVAKSYCTSLIVQVVYAMYVSQAHPTVHCILTSICNYFNIKF